MNRFLVYSLLVVSTLRVFAWGATGHRVIGLIAETHLNKKARMNISKVLGNETLAEVSNFMDFIKSEDSYDHMRPWHYMTVPDNTKYVDLEPLPEGDVYQTITRLIDELGNKQFTDEDEAFALKCLVHLIGDIHQPLHVGNGTDKGGNDLKLDFFWSNSNLHRVWDSGIIDNQKFSYTEYADWINHPTKEEIIGWQEDGIMQWVKESIGLRNQVYDLPENKKINYRYVYDNIDVVNKRLLQAGVRLAGVLNKIYG